MKYDFETIIDRDPAIRGTGKYRIMKDSKGNKPPKGIVPLSVADMEFRTAPCVIDAIKAEADFGVLGYHRLTDSFRESCQWMKTRHDWDVQPDWIVPFEQVVPALYNAVWTFTQPGDGILIQTPDYHHFTGATVNTGRKVLENRLVADEKGHYTVDFDDFREKAKQAKLFFLCSPQNPTGRVWTEEELRRMMELCLQYHVLVVSDEIHSDLIFHGKKHIPTASLSPEIAANVITGISGTKTFNLAGLQASTVVFPDHHKKEVFDHFWQCMDIHRNNAFSLTAMEAAFNHGEEWLEQLLPYLSANFDYVVDYCEKHIPKIKTYAPDATYLMWLDCRELGMTNEELHDFMIQKAKLGLNDGCSFGRSLNGYMRLNAACPRATLEKAMAQLEAAVNSL